MRELALPSRPRKRGPLALADGPASEEKKEVALPQPEENEETIGEQSVEWLCDRLEAAEPVLCAPQALKALMPMGKRQYQTPDLLKLLDFVAGRTKDDVLT